MKVNYFFLAFLLPLSFSFGQTSIDTVYLDSKWEQTAKSKAAYFRAIMKDPRGFYLCQDFWVTGELQMVGRLSALSPENRQGQFNFYYKNGALQRIILYRNNEIAGPIQRYDADGNLDLEVIWNSDSLDNAKIFRERILDFRRYVKDNLIYPEGLAAAGIEGRVITSFYINDRGKVDRFEITQSANQAFSDEAQRVIESYWRWPKPRYKGRGVWYQITYPVSFVLL